MEAILVVFVAALLYLVILPLFGLIAGIVIRTILPYAAGFCLLYAIVCQSCNAGQILWYTLFASLIWAAIVLHSRSQLQGIQGSYTWFEGHYSAAINVLTFSHLKRSWSKR